MNPLKIFHTGDGHFSPKVEDQNLFFKSADFFFEKVQEEEPDLIVIAGDLFDRAVNDTTGSGFPDLVAWISGLMEYAPVVTVTGTPTHDIAGCYEVFKFIDVSHRFYLLDPGIPYFLNGNLLSMIKDDGDSLLILGLPEPSKEHFLKDKRLGKAEADELINQGMRELLLGLGAIRRQYPDIPCLFVAHIEVANTPTCTGHIIQGGIKIGKDDLALVGADYYALGHIHLGQQIGDLPAYYCGSMFPVNWGELDQKGFNVVELGDYIVVDDATGEQIHECTVERVPFPHPPRKKIVVEAARDPEGEMGYDYDFSADEVEGHQIWVQVRATRDQRPTEGEKGMLLDYLDDLGATEGSKIEIVTIPTETVRSERISEAASLVDKLKVYAELSGETLNDSTIEKAADLETTARESGEAGEGLHIRVQKLVLRGAIGIKKGLGLDEIEIDLDQYEPGLIALVGVNGSGKSTLIENMHPYPQLLTRTGKLQDHFCLRDSFRDLYFTDDRTGTEYRAFMSIDGQNKSGSIEYFLNRWDTQLDEPEWVPATIEINGRKDPYEKEISRLFGSIELYLRSAFVSQKQPKKLPDLSDATPGEKKALFRELGGLEYLEVYSKTASETAKALESELITIKAKLERVDEIKQSIEDAQGNLKTTESFREGVAYDLEQYEKQGKELKINHDRLKAIVDKNAKLRTEYESVLLQQRDTLNRRTELRYQIKEYRSALEGKEATEKLIKEYEDLKAEEAKLNEEKSKYEGARARGLACYNELRDTVAEQERDLRDKKSEAEKAAQAVERERDIVLADANNLSKELRENPLSENCPTCDQKWPTDKLEEFKAKQDKKETRLTSLQNQTFESDKDLVEKKKAVEAAQKAIDDLVWPEEPKVEEYDDTKLNEASVKLSTYDIENIKDAQDRAQEAKVRIEEGEKQLKALETTLNTLNERASDLLNQIDEESDVEYESVGKQLEECRQQYIETDKELTRLNTEIEGLKKQIAEREAELEDLKALDEERKAKEIDLTEWQYLQRACGPNGIQALELDAMGPGIAEVANSILESAYGSRFQIEFRTTRIGGSGSKTKQIEDFQIWIHDSQTGDEQLLETLSGGESVWIKNAIYSAFGIIRARKTGTQFLTVYMDEADGALDPEARTAYFRMLEKAHQEAGRYHSIIVTHSPEAQETIGQKINMGDFNEANTVE